MGSRNLLISGIDVSRDLSCELAMELFDMVKRNPCTCVPFVIFRYPKSVAADHRYLVPNADRKPAAATYPIPGWDGPRWDPAPRVLRDAVWIYQVTVSKCEKAVF